MVHQTIKYILLFYVNAVIQMNMFILEWKKDTYAHRHTQTHTELLQAVGFVIETSWLCNVAWLGTLIIKAFRRYDSQCVFGECVCMCEREGETLEAVSCIVSLSEGKPEHSY